MTQGDGESITYNAFNKPLHISGGGNSTDFTYGADLMRYKQITPSGSTILYIDKLMEIETFGTSVNFKHYLGDVAILTKIDSLNDPTPGIRYFFRDRLGGISMIGDETGLVTEYRGYDAYGKPRDDNWADKSPATINSAVTDRGFTDHEHLDDWQLIHMNGRGYDYNLGRFLSIDPFIQDPGNSQSINAYAYIMNNPLSGTDPSGYSIEDECQVKPVTCSAVVAAESGGSHIGLAGRFGTPGNRGGLLSGFNGASTGRAPNNGLGSVKVGPIPNSSTEINELFSSDESGRAGVATKTAEEQLVKADQVMEVTKEAFGRLMKIPEFAKLVETSVLVNGGTPLSLEVIPGFISEGESGKNINVIRIAVDFDTIGFESTYDESEEFGNIADAIFEDDSVDYNQWEDAHLAENAFVRFSIERVLFHEISHNMKGLFHNQRKVIEETNVFAIKHLGETFGRKPRHSNFVHCAEVKCN